MYFTQEDFKKIEKWLLQSTVKDTQFADAATPLKGNETIAFVQGNQNVKTTIKDFVDQLFLLGVADFLNVTDKYGEKYLSIEQAIQLIPPRSRKIGQVITFMDTYGNWVIYQFQGQTLNQWNNINMWTNVISSIIVGETVPDEEDLTGIKQNNKLVLKFKNKNYSPNDFSGLGRVHLRKNITVVVDSNTGQRKAINYLTQDMLPYENTIYHVQYDYDLNGTTIAIPEGCTLQFEGGSLSNGTINSTGLIITGNPIFENVVGNIVSNVEIHTKWFGYNTSSINQACQLFSGCRIVIDSGVYTFDDSIIVPYDIELFAEPSTLNANKSGNIFSIYCEYTSINLQNLKILLGSNYSGNVIELRGNGYYDIRGYIRDESSSELYYHGIVERVVLNFPLIEGRNNQNTTALKIITNEGWQVPGDPYRFLYNKDINLSCSNIAYGVYLDCNNDIGTMTNNKYNLSFTSVEYGVRLSKMLSTSNRFRIVYQCDKVSKKILLNDNFENDINSPRYITIEYLEVWDPDVVDDESLLDSFIDNCAIMTIHDEAAFIDGFAGHKYIDGKRFFRLKNTSIQTWRDGHRGLSDGEIRCAYLTLADMSWIKANMLDYTDSTQAPNHRDCLMYMANTLNSNSPTRSVRMEFNVGPQIISQNIYNTIYKYLVDDTNINEPLSQLTKITIDFILSPYSNSSFAFGCGIRYIVYTKTNLETGNVSKTTYLVSYVNSLVSSLSTINNYKYDIAPVLVYPTIENRFYNISDREICLFPSLGRSGTFIREVGDTWYGFIDSSGRVISDESTKENILRTPYRKSGSSVFIDELAYTVITGSPSHATFTYNRFPTASEVWIFRIAGNDYNLTMPSIPPTTIKDLVYYINENLRERVKDVIFTRNYSGMQHQLRSWYNEDWTSNYTGDDFVVKTSSGDILSTVVFAKGSNNILLNSDNTLTSKVVIV